ncbi:H-NS family nucleoid-associated regulatory protein [Ralstonia pseudosolanacearum]|uniref:H-NS histone family protein n=1 Tax=Ralstonia pseudosolanacearum TaxID=1310165 RepID=UPI003D2BF3B1
MPSYQNHEDPIYCPAPVPTRIDALKARQRQNIIDMIVELMHEYTILPTEIAEAFFSTWLAADPATHKRPRLVAPNRLAPKYRNPATGETWAGRGKLPTWLAKAEQQGLQRESFLIFPTKIPIER